MSVGVGLLGGMTTPAAPVSAPTPEAEKGVAAAPDTTLPPTDQSSPSVYAATMDTLGVMIDTVVETERAKWWMAAVQAAQIDHSRRMAELVCHPVTSDGMRGWSPAETARRTIISELACALRVPEITAEKLIVESKTLVNDLPRTWAGLLDAKYSYRHVQVIIEGSWALPDELRVEFETAALPYAETLTASRFKVKARKIRERLDKASIAKRHEAAKNDRHVELDPAEDGMAWLNLYVEAPIAVAMYQKATEVARSLQGPNEPRTLAQLRADVLATMLLGGGIGGTSTLPPHDTSKDESGGVINGDCYRGDGSDDPGDSGSDIDTGGATETTAGAVSGVCDPFAHIRPRVALMVPVLSLLGLSDEPATLEGIGPIDIATARKLTASAPSITRILTHPETGTILSVGRKKYRVPKALKRWLEMRDQTCSKPGCGAPAYLCDLDHIEEWQHGGESSVQNLAHLCKKHHAEKHHTAWQTEMTDTGTLWTSPTGRKYLSPHGMDISTG
jgi:hypothetical protein